MTDLAREFSDAVCNVDGDSLRAVLAAGVPEDALQPSPHFGMAAIQTHGSTYELGDDGDKAVIVPCGRWDFPTWHLDDLVAFRLQQPERWWRRLGIADVLGDADGFSIEPKILHPTPQDWLRAGGKGLVVLEWSRNPVDLLQGAGALAAPESLKEKVYAAAARSAARDVRNLFYD